MSSRGLAFERHYINNDSASVGIFYAPINNSARAVEFKALVRRSHNYLNFKVGLFGSEGRIGQSLQGAGSMFLPGDTSELRNPIRSRAFAAITPGGLRIPNASIPTKPSRGYRCPEGFQYGGRFTDSRFSTCGQMLFDIFGLGRTLGQLTKPVSARMPSGPQVAGEVSPIPGIQPQEAQLIISRAVQIPKVGPSNPTRRSASVSQAISALRDGEDGATVMIRRDGFGLRPVVSTAILRTVPDNRNMEGATFLTAAGQLGTLGQDELGLLSNTGIAEIKYVTPNGVQLSLAKKRALTVGERRKLGRTVAEIARVDTSNDPVAKLREIANSSNGAIEYSENFGDINDPNDLITARIGGSKRQVRRWVYETFYSNKRRTAKKPESEIRPVTTNDVAAQQKITSLAEAIKHLDSGGDISQVIPSLRTNALRRTRSYQQKKIDRFNQQWRKAGLPVLTETTAQSDFEHIGTKFTSDIQKLVGLEAGRVVFAGSGKRQPYITSMRGDIKPADNLDNIDPASMLGLAVADFVTDTRDRNSGNTGYIQTGNIKNITSTDNRSSAFIGMPKTSQSARQKMKIDDFINTERSAFYARAFKTLSEQQRRQVVNQLDQIIQRLSNFSWEEYLARLNADGILSAAEKTHLAIMRGIFDARLSTLKTSKKTFTDLLGATG